MKASGVSCLTGNQGIGPPLANHDTGIDLEAVLGLPGVGPFLAFEFGDIQCQCDNSRVALQQLDIVRDIVAVRLKADAARLHALGRQVEAELSQFQGRALGIREGQREVVDIACRDFHARSYRLNQPALKCDASTLIEEE